MIIFIEGIDGAGKTTLYNALRDIRFEHIDGSKINFEQTVNAHNPYVTGYELEAFNMRLRSQRNSKDIYIYDRSPISELVYRMWDEKYCKYKLEFFEDLVRGTIGFAVIYCKPSNLKHAWDMRTERDKDDISTESDRDEIAQHYDSVMDVFEKLLHVPICLYDWTVHADISTVCKFINSLRI